MVAPPDNEVLWGHSLHHAHQGSPALLGLSLGARAGEILGVTGPRGAGKTTLLRCLSGQLVPDSGEVWFDGTALHTLSNGARERLRRDRFGWIGPHPRLVPELSARENAALPLLLAGAGHRAAALTAQEWLERLDAGDLAAARPAELTQAQRQRVAIARALASSPQVLFADEPTACLHTPDRVQALRTLTAAARSHGITVLLATTEADADGYADRIVRLTDGRLCESAPEGAVVPAAAGAGVVLAGAGSVGAGSVGAGSAGAGSAGAGSAGAAVAPVERAAAAAAAADGSAEGSAGDTPGDVTAHDAAGPKRGGDRWKPWKRTGNGRRPGRGTGTAPHAPTGTASAHPGGTPTATATLPAADDGGAGSSSENSGATAATGV